MATTSALIRSRLNPGGSGEGWTVFGGRGQRGAGCRTRRLRPVQFLESDHSGNGLGVAGDGHLDQQFALLQVPLPAASEAALRAEVGPAMPSLPNRLAVSPDGSEYFSTTYSSAWSGIVGV